MPSTRKFRGHHHRGAVPAVVLALLNGTPVAPSDELDALLLDYPLGAGTVGGETLACSWDELGEGITKRSAERRPGTRPSAWWQWSAPEPRRRLGGTGQPAHEVLAYALRLEFGVRADWVMPWAGEVSGGRFKGTPADRAAPPV